ncbi:MAG TPA: cytochrome c oxidase subunit 3 [Saprospiraceae bacterium]|nr:cytochrome c oxidase subunit 3 [Saprospiraceae bacterium]
MPFIQMIDKSLAPSRYQAMRFGLWIGMASITMMFAALTSSYLVRKPAGNWYEFKLPNEFFISTILILLSSYTIEWAYRNFKKGNLQPYRLGILLTWLLGIGFLVSQVLAWQALAAKGITVDLNVSGSFLYAMSGIHALHVFGGIGALTVSLLTALFVSGEITDWRVLKLDLVRQYWHFVDIVWIYLLLFLILQ